MYNPPARIDTDLLLDLRQAHGNPWFPNRKKPTKEQRNKQAITRWTNGRRVVPQCEGRQHTCLSHTADRDGSPGLVLLLGAGTAERKHHGPFTLFSRTSPEGISLETQVQHARVRRTIKKKQHGSIAVFWLEWSVQINPIGGRIFKGFHKFTYGGLLWKTNLMTLFNCHCEKRVFWLPNPATDDVHRILHQKGYHGHPQRCMFPEWQAHMSHVEM